MKRRSTPKTKKIGSYSRKISSGHQPIRHERVEEVPNET